MPQNYAGSDLELQPLRKKDEKEGGRELERMLEMYIGHQHRLKKLLNEQKDPRRNEDTRNS